MTCITLVEPTPNPNSYKFVLSYPFMGDDMWECTTDDAARASPLAEAIWSLNQEGPTIRQVFFHDNMIIVAKHPDVAWELILDKIQSQIELHFAANLPLFPNVSAHTDMSDQDRDIIMLIAEVIRDYIQPAVKGHGGFVQFQRLQDGIVYISMHGACAECPSSTLTLRNGIEQLIKLYVPGVVGVELGAS